jgi:hypothetical protein
VEIAWEAVARTPRCMLWLDMTDDGMLFTCLISLLTPTRSSPLSPLRKINASPATNLFELTKTLQPVVSRCLLGCPVKKNGKI